MLTRRFMLRPSTSGVVGNRFAAAQAAYQNAFARHGGSIDDVGHSICAAPGQGLVVAGRPRIVCMVVNTDAGQVRALQGSGQTLQILATVTRNLGLVKVKQYLLGNGQLPVFFGLDKAVIL